MDVVIFIEFDREQHYHPVGFGEQDYETVLETLKKVLENDARKNSYWKDNKLPYLRISYQHRQKDSVLHLLKKFLIENNCLEATPVLKGSDPESVPFHYQIRDKQQQQQQMIDFQTAIEKVYEVKEFTPPPPKPLPEPDFFFKANDWPEGYGPREQDNSSNRTRKRNEDFWYESFEQLEEYKKQKGDCNLPQSYPILGAQYSLRLFQLKMLHLDPGLQGNDVPKQIKTLKESNLNTTS